MNSGRLDEQENRGGVGMRAASGMRRPMIGTPKGERESSLGEKEERRRQMGTANTINVEIEKVKNALLRCSGCCVRRRLSP